MALKPLALKLGFLKPKTPQLYGFRSSVTGSTQQNLGINEPSLRLAHRHAQLPARDRIVSSSEPSIAAWRRRCAIRTSTAVSLSKFCDVAVQSDKQRGTLLIRCPLIEAHVNEPATWSWVSKAALALAIALKLGFKAGFGFKAND